mgnify:CR=1 FL=1
MHLLLLSYTKLSSLNNYSSVYLNLYCTFFCGKIWGFLFTKNRKNRLCFSFNNIEYIYIKICDHEKSIMFYICKQSEHITYHLWKRKQKINRQRILFNQTFLLSRLWMCYWSNLNQSNYFFCFIKSQVNISY